MALNLSQYVDPGVYVGEVVVPGSVSVVTAPLTVCLVGTGSRLKRATNEAVLRGTVNDETVSFEESAGLPGVYSAALEYKSNRRVSQLQVKRDDVELDQGYFSFAPAFVLSNTHGGTLDLDPNNSICLAIDGKRPVTIQFAAGASDSTVIADNTIDSGNSANNRNLIVQTLASISNMNTVSVDSVVEGINKALSGASELGYGVAYAAVASKSGNKILLKSPQSGQMSDVKLYAAHVNSATSTVFSGVTLPFSAESYVILSDDQYSNTSTYVASYVATDSDSSDDALLNTSVQKVIRVGKYAGVTSYSASGDYTLDSDKISWAVSSSAVVIGSAGPYSGLSATSTLSLSIDNLGTITVPIAAVSSAPGSAAPASISSVTALEIASNINAVLADAKAYGPEYASVATVDGGKLKLTSKLAGSGASIVVGPTPAASIIFGTNLTTLSTYGSGARPSPGQIYFVTYEYTRPASDYNLAKRFFTPDSLYADIGLPSRTNKLAVAAQICFENGAPSVMVSQVDDSSFVGNPTRAEVKAALDAAGLTSVATEVCLLDTRDVCRADLIDHVSSQNSVVEKNWRRGWFGMPRGTQIGDKDTPGTYIHTAVSAMSVPADSPARGRMVLVAPGSASRTFRLEGGGETTMELDSSYVAAAIAARMTSFTSPAETLLRKSIVGFNSDDFPVYVRAERAALASNGITVVTLTGGQLRLTDPVTTEDAGGKLATFREISASTQKDAVTTAVTDVVDANLVGVVPSDVSAFMLSVKSYIAGALTSLIASGAIAPFKTPSGGVRDIDLASDIQVFQDRSDPTKYAFRYYFNLRLPAKRFFGEYSVNNPFFGQ